MLTVRVTCGALDEKLRLEQKPREEPSGQWEEQQRAQHVV